MFSYEQMENLNELEMKIYNYIITHAPQVSKMTIRQLAEVLHVSSTTILRFCSKLGYEGYSEFKYRFKEYMEGAAQQNPAEDFSVIEDFFAKVKKGDLDKEIWQAAEIICRKDRVFYIGMGTSGTMGKYGARYLSNYGKYAMYVDDPFYPTDDNFYENTVVVVMSVSGEQRFLFKQVQGLKKGGAIIISITNSKKCRLAEAADYSLAYFTGLCSTNLVDFDALWGHRRGPEGYGKEIEKFDRYLGILLNEMQEDDRLILTADHGNEACRSE